MGKRAKESKGVEAAATGKKKAVGSQEAAGERDGNDRHAMTEQRILLISKAIADPKRMAMLQAIAQRSANCDSMRQCAGISAATLSHHMKQLEAAGLIETVKDGRFLRATMQKKVWKSYLASLKALAG